MAGYPTEELEESVTGPAKKVAKGVKGVAQALDPQALREGLAGLIARIGAMRGGPAQQAQDRPIYGGPAQPEDIRRQQLQAIQQQMQGQPGQMGQPMAPGGVGMPGGQPQQPQNPGMWADLMRYFGQR